MWKKLGLTSVLPLGARQHAPGDQAAEDWKEFVQTFDFFALIRAWPSIVGEDLAKSSVPLRLRSRTLFILTRYPAVSDQLNWMSVQLRQKVTQRFPTLAPLVEKLAFETNESFFVVHQQRVELKPPRETFHPQDPRYKRLRAEAERLFAAAVTPEEKERWISLYVQSAHTE
jgi:hypothetical protein